MVTTAASVFCRRCCCNIFLVTKQPLGVFVDGINCPSFCVQVCLIRGKKMLGVYVERERRQS